MQKERVRSDKTIKNDALAAQLPLTERARALEHVELTTQAVRN